MILMVKLKDYERGVETLSLHHQMNLKLKNILGTKDLTLFLSLIK